MKNLKLVFVLLNLFPGILFLCARGSTLFSGSAFNKLWKRMLHSQSSTGWGWKSQKQRSDLATAFPQINATGELIDNVSWQAFVFPAKTGRSKMQVPMITLYYVAALQYTASINVQANQQIFNQSSFTGIKVARVSEDYYRLKSHWNRRTIYQVVSLFYRVAALKTQQIVLETNQKNCKKSLNYYQRSF